MCLCVNSPEKGHHEHAVGMRAPTHMKKMSTELQVETGNSTVVDLPFTFNEMGAQEGRWHHHGLVEPNRHAESPAQQEQNTLECFPSEEPP